MHLITKYLVVEDNKLKIVVDRINKLITEGWQPQGGISFCNEDRYCQAMVIQNFISEVEIEQEDIEVIKMDEDPKGGSYDVVITYKYKGVTHQCAETGVLDSTYIGASKVMLACMKDVAHNRYNSI